MTRDVIWVLPWATVHPASRSMMMGANVLGSSRNMTGAAARSAYPS